MIQFKRLPKRSKYSQVFDYNFRFFNNLSREDIQVIPLMNSLKFDVVRKMKA